MKTKILYAVGALLGLAMIFLGTRFFFSPEAATADFGIHFNAENDYSFHYIKGIRDVFSGLVICVFVLLKDKRALGVTLLAGAIIPANDLLIVLSKPYNGFSPAVAHIMAIVICVVCGTLLLAGKPKKAL